MTLTVLWPPRPLVTPGGSFSLSSLSQRSSHRCLVSQTQVRSSALSLLTPQLSWTSPRGALMLLTGVGWTSTSPRSSSSAYLLFYHSLEISLQCHCNSQGTMKPLFKKGRHLEDIHRSVMWRNGCKLYWVRVWLFTETFKTLERHAMNEANWRTLSISGLYFL